MNLVKQQNLFFKNEKSDKVYEVSLFQVDDCQYIVNFRYGRRGSVLREGTKTVFPVSMEQAEKVFQDLLQSKRKKGYSESMDIASKNEPESDNKEVGNSEAEETITEYLKDLSKNIPVDSNWKPSRIIWRAAELNIIEVHNYIATLMLTDDVQQKYACIWYCGRVKTNVTKEALLSEKIDGLSIWYNIHRAGLVMNEDSTTIENLINTLPISLEKAVREKKYLEFFNYLESSILEMETKNIDFLLDSYLLSIHIPEIKKSVLHVLPTIALIPNKWNIIRYIYKVAEMLNDAEVLGILYKRISHSAPYFNSSPYGGTYLNRRFTPYKDILKSEKPSVAFSNKTKAYFERRNLRALMEAGQMQSEYYCDLASSILIQYNEADRVVHPNAYTYTYNRETRSYNSTTFEFPDIAHLSYLFAILFSQGTRYGHYSKSLFNYRGTKREQSEREDAFPSLWDTFPQYLVRLLTLGQLKEVADFAILALKRRNDLSSLLSIQDLVLCLQSPFDNVVRIAITEIRKSYDPDQPNIKLLAGLIRSNSKKGQKLAFELIEKNATPIQGNFDFLDACISSINPDIQSWLILNIQEGDYDASELQSYINTFISRINDEDFDRTKIQLNTITEVFPKTIQHVDQQIIFDLIGSDKEILVLTGCTLFNKSKISVSAIPYETIQKLIQSENKSIQEQGLIMFSKLTDEELISRKNILFDLVVSEEASIRIIALDTIGRISTSDSSFQKSSYLQLVDLLEDKYENEQIPDSIYSLLNTQYKDQLLLLGNKIDDYIVSDKREIHLLVLEYIKQIKLDEWTVQRIASLGNHDMKEVRTICENYYSDHVPRIKYEKEDGIKILNTRWKETRAFSESYFDKNFGENEWDPDIIISLCDNIIPEVQQYGIRILGKYFRDENGIKFLTELSQHPNSNMQLYTSNYLDKFAFNNMDILQDITFYFNSILYSRNKDSAVRKRVIAFLDKQADQGPEYADYVAKLLVKQKNSIAVIDRAQIIKTLFKIKRKHSEIHTGIEIVKTEIRR